ncbi:MAG: nuclear transport factor 2 family protein [bacterium]|nr:nuclear transport factor 2 family protein [bacterium]
MGVAENKKVLVDLLAAIEGGDREAIEGIFLPDGRWVIPKGAPEAVAGMHRGGALIADMMVGAIDRSFVAESVDWRPGLIVGEADVVMLEANLRATRQDGEVYDNCYVFVAEFDSESGRIAELREHVDTRYAARFFEG